MSRILKRIGIGIGALIVVLLLVIALFPWNRLRGPVSRELSAKLDRPVHMAALHGSLFWRPHIQVRGLTIGNPRWAGGGQMVTVQRIDLELAFWPLFRGAIVLPKVALVHPVVRLYRRADGRANWDFGAPSKPPANKKTPALQLPLVHRLIIESGQLTALDAVHKMSFAGSVDAGNANGAAPGAPSPTAKAVKAQAQRHGASASRAKQQASRVAANTGTGFELLGKGELNAKPFTLRVSGGPLIWAETHKPYPFDVRMAASDIRASARGVLPKPFDLTKLDVLLSLSGDDLADGYYLTGLALPNTPPYSISGRLRQVGTRYEFTGLKGRLGASDIHGVVTVGFVSGVPDVHADLISHTLDLADLGPTFGGKAPTPTEEAKETQASGHPSKAALHHALGKKAKHEVTGKTASKAAVSRFLLPTSKLQVQRLRGMDATLRYHADEVKSQSMPLREVDVRLQLRNDVLRIAPFAFTFPEGKLAGTATIDVRHRIPAERLDVRLTRVQLAQFHAKGTKHPPFEGTLVGRLKLHGRGDSMHAFASTATGTLSLVVPHGHIEQAFAEFAGIDVARGLGLMFSKKQKETPVRCGIADFTARDGIAKVAQVVFDTKVVIVTGLGGIDMRNERVHLQLTGAPKKFRLGVLRSPIEIRGTLLHPSVGLKTSKLLAQGAVATVLGAIGTPLAAVAAFVDPGLNKSADCQRLLVDAKSMGAPLRTAQAQPRKRPVRRKPR
jgi:uncharacterized protein involved in outer membrane biogenesis